MYGFNKEYPVLSRYQHAKMRKTLMQSLYDDCYFYGLNDRNVRNNSEGSDETPVIFDSTASDSTSKFASKMQIALTPPEYMWQRFKPGTEIPASQRDDVQILLDVAREKYFEYLWKTNFDAEIPEVYRDLAVGTGALLIQDYDDGYPCTFTAVPASELAIEEGPNGLVWGVYWERKIKYGLLPYCYKLTNISDTLARAIEKSPDDEVCVLDATYWDPSIGRYQYEVILLNSIGGTSSGSAPERIFEDTFVKWPWVISRWARRPTEVLGRGPLTHCIADIKTLNKTVEFILQNASLAIAGVYTAADDGVLNPATVEISPGVVIPVAFNGGVNGRSLDVLPRSGDFDVAQLILKDYRDSIRRKLYDYTSPETVRSAEEMRQRAKDLSDDIGSAWGRIKFELINGLVERTSYIFSRKGLIPKFELDGKQVSIFHQSPLADIQADEELRGISAAIGQMGLIHPMAAAITFEVPDLLRFIASRRNIPQFLVRKREAISQSLEEVGQAVGQGAVDPNQAMGG
jgi:hypothetical protein